MALPFNVPYTFGTATTSIPLSQLDNNFSTVVQAVNAIGNGSNALSNVSITGGSITNVTITSLVGPVSAGSGGTGLSNITANAVMLGNGTNSVKIVSPGAGGNVLTSDGNTWVSQAGGFPSVTGNAGTSLVTDGSLISWGSGVARGTAQTPTTTNADFTGIPSWAKRVTVVFSAVSTDASTAVNIQLGTGGVFATSGYASTAWTGGSGDTSTSSFIVDAGGQTAATSRNGSIVFHNIDGNTWVGSGNITRGGSIAINAIAGTVTLSGALDSLRVLSGSGNVFDAGTINVFWE